MPLGDFKDGRRVNPGFMITTPSVRCPVRLHRRRLGPRRPCRDVFNTRNNDSEYSQRQDLQLRLAGHGLRVEDIRVGVQGYFVRQLQADTSNRAAAQAATDAQGGNKASVNAIGPAVAWLMNGGEMLIEGKFDWLTAPRTAPKVRRSG